MKEKVIRVYVAGPYSNGDVALNVREAITVGNELYDNGFIPFIPHFTHFWHMIFPRPYESWLAYDDEWLVCCDCVLRLPGFSNGADKEVDHARQIGLPIYDSIGALLVAYGRHLS